MFDSDYIAIVESIYDAAGNPSRWSVVLEQFSRLSRGPGFIVAHDPAMGSGSCLTQANWPSDWVAAYDKYYASRNAWLARVASRPVGKAEPAEFFLPRADLLKTEWYNDFLRPQQLISGLGVTLFNDRTRFVCAGSFLPRHEDAGHEALVALLQRLTPHMQRALQVNRQLARADFRWQAAEKCFDRLNAGVVLVGGNRCVLFANSEAQRILREGDGLGLDREGHLLAAAGDDDRRIQMALQSVVSTEGRAGTGSGDIVAVRRRSGQRPYGLLIAGLRPPASMFEAARTIAVVFILPPNDGPTVNAEVIEKLLDLTPAEARVVALLASGMPAREIAEATRTSYHTVRTLMSRAMAKTQTTTQANLVRLALAACGGVLARPSAA